MGIDQEYGSQSSAVLCTAQLTDSTNQFWREMMDRKRIKMDMERVDKAQLNNALTTTSAQSRPRLNEEESLALTILVAETAKRYPSQDLTDSVGEIMQDFEQLALKYSLRKVRKALKALRIKAGQSFFPRPDEVAEEIEYQNERAMNDAIRNDGKFYMKKHMKMLDDYYSPEEVAWRKSQGYE
jgi:hypothetical protein